MTLLDSFSIQKKLVIAMLTAVIISTSVVGFVGHSKAKELLVSRLQQSDLPNLLLQVRNAVNGDILQMKVLARAIASNPFILDWLENGATAEQEATVIKSLKFIADDNNLSNASFVDRQSNSYWKQTGFLRVLQQGSSDGWYFAFKNSGQAESASIYAEENGDVNVFVNYQDLKGRGSSGVSKSFNDMVDYLAGFKIEQSGFVYLVDNTGLVKVHKDQDKSGNTKLSSLYENIDVNSLLSKNEFTFQETDELIIATSYIASLDWYVVAEVPKSELYMGLDESRNSMLIWLLIIVALFSFVSVVLAKSLTKPINKLAEVFNELGAGDGDLSYRLSETGSDEISRLAQGFNRFIDNIHIVVADVSSTSKNVRQTSQKVYQGADKLRVEAEEQRNIASQVATAIGQMGATISEIAVNATHAADATNEATTQAQNASVVVQDSTQSINEMADNMETVSDIIESLADKSNAISSVLDVIRSISEQTNLLALNAAIEAARAGEQGRGFAVVADEVRNLARRASESTDEIHQMITLLQNDSQMAVDGVRESKEKAVLGMTSAERTKEALNGIVLTIQQLADLNTQVATATEEQSLVVNEINIHVNANSDSTENSATTSAEMASSSESLSAMAQNLDGLVARFKI